MIPCYDSVSATESSARLVFGWLATARHSKTSHGDGGFVYCKRGHRWEELFKLEEFGERWSPLLKWLIAWNHAFTLFLWFPDLGFQSGLVKLYVKKWQISHCITNP